MRMEFWAGDEPFVFDGEVLEVFSGDGYRWHPTQVEEISVTEGRKQVLVLRVDAGRFGGISGPVIARDQIPTLQAVIAALDEVRASRYGMGPIKNKVDVT